MKRVYVVMHREYEYDNPVAAFSTRRAADQYAARDPFLMIDRVPLNPPPKKPRVSKRPIRLTL
jgi:hypothetical protein